jgi:CheY-like chemotaxis protein
VANILVVDDRPFDRAYMVELLSIQKHSVFEASNGVEALAWLRSKHSDLVIIRIMLPATDGLEFVRRLRAEPSTAAVPIIIVTPEHDNPEATTLAQIRGIANIVIEPSTPGKILRIVESALRTASHTTP